jgi:hypothetical protein
MTYVAKSRFWRRKWSPDDQLSSRCADDTVLSRRLMSPDFCREITFLATKFPRVGGDARAFCWRAWSCACATLVAGRVACDISLVVAMCRSMGMDVVRERATTGRGFMFGGGTKNGPWERPLDEGMLRRPVRVAAGDRGDEPHGSHVALLRCQLCCRSIHLYGIRVNRKGQAPNSKFFDRRKSLRRARIAIPRAANLARVAGGF